MAKGQLRSNREAKKPKQKKDVVLAPVSLAKGMAQPAPPPKKKG
jgi:hypothetical protein